ncbi:MAG: rhodanese-like domain-containing protein [Planctomycetota bacterium]
MDWIPILASLATLGLAMFAVVRSSGAIAAAEDAKRDAIRRVENQGEEIRAEVETLRRLLVRVVKGEATAEMIEEGQLWRDVDAAVAKRVVEEIDDVFVLDVRNPDETASGVVVGATLIPIDDIVRRKGEIPRDGRPILVYCAAGARSAAACEILSRDGVDGLLNFEEGFGAWTGATEIPEQD